MQGRAKVQLNGPRLFIYLPLKQCEEDGIVKGSRVDFVIKNTGLQPEPPSKTGLRMADQKEKETLQ